MEMSNVEDILKDILTALNDIKYEMDEYNHHIDNKRGYQFDIVLLEHYTSEIYKKINGVAK